MLLIWPLGHRQGVDAPVIIVGENPRPWFDISRTVHGLTAKEYGLLISWTRSENAAVLNVAISHGFNNPSGEPLPPELRGGQCEPCHPDQCKECLLEKLGLIAQNFRRYVEETKRNDPT
jgi:hypothetical protein